MIPCMQLQLAHLKCMAKVPTGLLSLASHAWGLRPPLESPISESLCFQGYAALDAAGLSALPSAQLARP